MMEEPFFDVLFCDEETCPLKAEVDKYKRLFELALEKLDPPLCEVCFLDADCDSDGGENCRGRIMDSLIKLDEERGRE